MRVAFLSSVERRKPREGGVEFHIFEHARPVSLDRETPVRFAFLGQMATQLSLS